IVDSSAIGASCVIHLSKARVRGTLRDSRVVFSKMAGKCNTGRTTGHLSLARERRRVRVNIEMLLIYQPSPSFSPLRKTGRRGCGGRTQYPVVDTHRKPFKLCLFRL